MSVLERHRLEWHDNPIHYSGANEKAMSRPLLELLDISGCETVQEALEWVRSNKREGERLHNLLEAEREMMREAIRKSSYELWEVDEKLGTSQTIERREA